jgi:hypothetical protein
MASDDRLAAAGGVSATYKVELASRGALLVTEQVIRASARTSTARENLPDLVAGVNSQFFRERIDFCNFGGVISVRSSVPN